MAQEPQNRKQSHEKARDFYNKANVEQQSGDFASSVALLDSAIHYFPQFTDAYFSLAGSYEQLSEYSRALYNYEAVLRLRPGFEGALFRKAICLYQLRQFAQAKSCIDYLITNSGQSETRSVFYRYSSSGDLVISTDSQLGPEYFMYRGLVELELGNWEQAKSDMDSAVVLSNHSPDYLINRGVFLQRLGRPVEAIADFEEVLEKDPGNQTALVNLFIVAPQRGEIHFDENQAIITGIMAPELLAQMAGEAFREAKYEKAITHYSEAISLASSNTDWLVNRALCYSKTGEYERAEKDLLEALSHTNFSPRAYLHLANTYSLQGNFRSALTYYNLFLALEPGYGLAYYNRGLSHDGLGNDEKACQDLTKAHQLGVPQAEKTLQSICVK